jgi:hypothetical protein
MNLWKTLITAATLLIIPASAYAQTGHWSEPVPVPGLNDPSGEAYPFLSGDGNIMLLITRGGISMSHWNGNSWATPVLLPPIINSPDGLERASAITPDHRHIYWISWRAGGAGRWDIWRCSWDESTNTFGAAECLGANVNSDYYEWGMCFTPDGQRMYFLSNVHYKNGQYGQGDMDIWYCNWDSTLGDWGLPYNIGRPVNAASLEDTPHITCTGTYDTCKLYFCSDWGHGVPGWQGSLEIFYATWDGQHWGNIVNVGAPINSPVEDESPCLTPDGKTMYFITRENRVPYATKHLMVSYWETSDIEDTKSGIDSSLEVSLYPNPSNLTLSIVIESKKLNGSIRLIIYDINGKEVRNLGNYGLDSTLSLKWDGTNSKGNKVSSGVYFLKAINDNNIILKKTFSFIK